MAKKPLTWLEFLAIENRLNALLHICKEKVPESEIIVYSLSNNTLWKFWVDHYIDGIFDESLYDDYDLLSRSTIKLTESGVTEGLYVEIDLFSDGCIGCSTHLRLPDEYIKTDATRLLNETNEIEVIVRFEEHKELFNTINTVFRILKEALNEPEHKAFDTLDDYDEEAIKKYIIGKKTNY